MIISCITVALRNAHIIDSMGSSVMYPIPTSNLDWKNSRRPQFQSHENFLELNKALKNIRQGFAQHLCTLKFWFIVKKSPNHVTCQFCPRPFLNSLIFNLKISSILCSFNFLLSASLISWKCFPQL